ncbi:type II secretion system minor pseudopilin GspI [Bermanella sp. R86510]|uniref:type II secretion system minor pseudopilin GspI n=1 Tax=unclassified Bermanella TaxID=2627862 RepID=UPI0037C80B00
MKQAGFTLLEVMVAITVFALVASTLSQSSAITVDNQIHLERKMLASWIAENEINLSRSLPYADIQSDSSEITYAERKWIVTKQVNEQKQFPGIPLPLEIKKMIVSVATKESPDSPVHSLTAYVANDDV